jgi:hypothetical protein
MSIFSWFKRKPIDETVTRHKIENLTVLIYDDVRHLNAVYRSLGGMQRRVKGFYHAKCNTIHAIRDSKVIGHEVRHILGEKHEAGRLFNEGD